VQPPPPATQHFGGQAKVERPASVADEDTTAGAPSRSGQGLNEKTMPQASRSPAEAPASPRDLGKTAPAACPAAHHARQRDASTTAGWDPAVPAHWGLALSPREKIGLGLPLSSAEIAHLLGVPDRTVRNAAKDGRLVRSGTLRQAPVFEWTAVLRWLGGASVTGSGRERRGDR